MTGCIWLCARQRIRVSVTDDDPNGIRGVEPATVIYNVGTMEARLYD